MNDFHFDFISRDPIQTYNGSPFAGILSNIGIIFWCSTIAILLFSSKIAQEMGRPKALYRFFFFSGLLTILMMIDDLFMMHDVIFPEYLNLDENFFYVFYGSSVITLLYFFRRVIVKSDYILFLLAFFLLAGSVITDVVVILGLNIKGTYLIEDGFKFLGIISWFVYFTRICYTHIRPIDKYSFL